MVEASESTIAIKSGCWPMFLCFSEVGLCGKIPEKVTDRNKSEGLELQHDYGAN